MGGNRRPRYAVQVSEQSLIAVQVAGWAVAATLGAAPASAQSLTAVLAAARDHAIDVREAEALREEARAAVDEGRARLLPSFTATGAYQRNEYEVIVTIPTGADPVNAVITPYDQLSATLTVSVPIVDLSAWETFFASERSADAASARAESAVFDASLATATAYYQLVAAHAVLTSAERARATAEDNLAYVTSRLSSGLGSELDQARAAADLARAGQTVAEADLQVVLAARNLEVLTGVEPSGEELTLVRGSSLEGEGELDDWLAHLSRLPSVRAASLDREAAERSRDAAWMALLPTVSGAASERLTNAAGFGPEAQWSLSVTATFTLDFGRSATIGAREDAVAVASVREERALTDAETRVREAFHRVRSLLARVEAARAGTAASERGVTVAHARYEAGTGTALDVSNAERDRFAAEVSEIQAEADLLLQRALLRIRTGVALGERP